MATYLGTSAVFEIRSAATAGNLGGGGFNPANANFIANWTATAANTASPVVSSVSYSFVSGDIGATFYVKSGTNWTQGSYTIASVSGGSATLSAAIGAATQVSNNRYQPNIVVGCATTASPTAGNCGIDYSQQNAARFTATDLTGATTTCTSATNPFGPQDAGNFLCLASGTGVTAGFYEIVSVATVTATLDRTAGTTYTGVTYYLGGAVSLGGSTTGITDNIFLLLGAASTTAGCRYFCKNGTYTPVASVNTLTGGTSWPAIFEGYNVSRGDRPSIASGNQPIFSMGANSMTWGDDSQTWCMTVIGGSSTTSLCAAGTSSIIINSKFKNSSTTAAAPALMMQFGNSIALGCELISYNGYGAQLTGQGSIIGCFIHDCNIGIACSATTPVFITNNIIASCTTECINETSNFVIAYGNTLYGNEAKFGIGINNPFALSVTVNNIIYGFVSGIGGATGTYNGESDYNCYFNNTNNIAAAKTGAFIGANDLTTTNPTFTNVTNLTGTTATSATNVLTDSGKNFTTAGVIANQSMLHITSASGATIAVYGITAVGTTTITTDNTIGTGTAINYFIRLGDNFLPTGAV